MRKTWPNAVNGVGTYSTIRLWNKGKYLWAMVILAILVGGPLVFGTLLALAIIGIAYIFPVLVVLGVMWGVIHNIECLMFPPYFFYEGRWWKDRLHQTPKLMPEGWVERRFSPEDRKKMQARFARKNNVKMPEVQ